MDLRKVLCLLLVQFAWANVEKTIFLGPATVNIPNQHPTLSDLQIDVLNPESWSLRTHITAEFPSPSSQNGKATWVLLDGLTHGKRYEVRICWAATQPTAFSLDTYELPLVWDSPELITSLAEYSSGRQKQTVADDEQVPRVHVQKETSPSGDSEVSVLFLRILAAADYFTTNQTLMEHVPPVYVDVILDPFIFNVLPRSLLPTGLYIIAVAIASWFVARYVSSWLRDFMASGTDTEKEKKKQ